MDLIPQSEFARARGDLALIADMCRANALVAVKRAGSGHLGSSFSAMDVVVHLFDPDTRSYYALEDVWADAVPVDWERV